MSLNSILLNSTAILIYFETHNWKFSFLSGTKFSHLWPMEFQRLHQRDENLNKRMRPVSFWLWPHHLSSRYHFIWAQVPALTMTIDHRFFHCLLCSAPAILETWTSVRSATQVPPLWLCGNQAWKRLMEMLRQATSLEFKDQWDQSTQELWLRKNSYPPSLRSYCWVECCS